MLAGPGVASSDYVQRPSRDAATSDRARLPSLTEIWRPEPTSFSKRGAVGNDGLMLLIRSPACRRFPHGLTAVVYSFTRSYTRKLLGAPPVLRKTPRNCSYHFPLCTLYTE